MIKISRTSFLFFAPSFAEVSNKGQLLGQPIEHESSDKSPS